MTGHFFDSVFPGLWCRFRKNVHTDRFQSLVLKYTWPFWLSHFSSSCSLTILSISPLNVCGYNRWFFPFLSLQRKIAQNRFWLIKIIHTSSLQEKKWRENRERCCHILSCCCIRWFSTIPLSESSWKSWSVLVFSLPLSFFNLSTGRLCEVL